jgi:type I restriction enzyme M protein
MLLDASNLGTSVKEGKNKKTLLSSREEEMIIDTFRKASISEGFAITPTLDEIKSKDYSFAPGQYFDVVIEYRELNAKEFATELDSLKNDLKELFEEGKKQEVVIIKKLMELSYSEKS